MRDAALDPASVYKTAAGGANSTELDGVAVTGANTYYSIPTQKTAYLNPSYHLQWTGTPTGVFTVWISNKKAPDPANDNDWVQITLAIAIVQPAGAAGKDLVDLSGLPFGWVRLKYVNSASTGTIFAFVAGC